MSLTFRCFIVEFLPDVSALRLHTARREVSVMLGSLAIFICICDVAFPALMLYIVYPFSRRASVFFSNWISTHCARIIFAIFSMYRKFHFLKDTESLSLLPGQYMVISNHQSLFDIVVYLNFLGGKRTRFVAKDALAKVPMVGKMLKSQGHCVIPRQKNPSYSMYAIERFARRAVEDNFIPVIFPEGTRSRNGEVGHFYSAGFRRLAEASGLPIAVCALDGGWKIAKFNLSLKNLYNISYHVKVLKVFESPASKNEEIKILEESRALIESQLAAWRALP